MTATQQQKRMTLGRATRSVAMRICSGQMADEGMATTLVISAQRVKQAGPG